MSEPRLAGLRKPTAANPTVQRPIMRSCAPVPTKTVRSMGAVVGGRKTSACTSFHPDSSLMGCGGGVGGGGLSE